VPKRKKSPHRTGNGPNKTANNKNPPQSMEMKVLYVMAYLNLGVAIGIIVVMSLWRWG
jgi:hypothetical protein